MSAQVKLTNALARILVEPGRGNHGFPGMNLGFVVLAAGAVSTPVLADSPQDAAAEGVIAEVIVTAQKRSERLLDVPMSVAAISGDQLQAAGVGGSNDLGQVTPGLLITNVGTGYTPAIRGISSSGTSVGDESNVALYIDDVYVGNTLAGMFDLPDIERIEVLKGPQGTLFGRNATGGAVRIVTRAPSFTPRASVSADYGFDFKEIKLGGYVSGPLSEQVAASLSVSSRTGDGFVEGSGANRGKTYGDPDNYLYRGKLLFKPSDTFQVTIIADTAQNDNEFGALPTAEGQNPFPGPGSIANTPYRYAGLTQPQQLVKMDSGSVDITWSPSDAFTVRSITAYRDFDLTYQVDIDRTNQVTSALALKAEQQNITQELNFFGPADAKLSWQLGAYYYHSDASNPYFTSFVGDAPNGTVIAEFVPTVKTKAWAGFFDLTWNLTDAFHATLGGRYTSETKDYHYRDTVRPGGAALRDVGDEETWTSPTYRGVLRYDFTPNSNIYVSLSNGFKSGVYNAFSPVPIPVEPEEIDALEIGAKTRLANGLTLTAAAYAYNYDDMQVQSQTMVNNVPLLTLQNAATAEIRGVEFTIDGNVTEALSFNVGVNWTPTAEYTDFRSASITVPIIGSEPVVGRTIVPFDASDSRLVKAPKWMATARVTYSTQMLGGRFAATVNNAYTGRYNWQAADLTEVPSYDILNARISWSDSKDRYTVSLWGTNVTDEVYSTYTSPNIRGNTQTFNQPRQIGVGFSANF